VAEAPYREAVRHVFISGRHCAGPSGEPTPQHAASSSYPDRATCGDARPARIGRESGDVNCRGESTAECRTAAWHGTRASTRMGSKRCLLAPDRICESWTRTSLPTSHPVTPCLVRPHRVPVRPSAAPEPEESPWTAGSASAASGSFGIRVGFPAGARPDRPGTGVNAGLGPAPSRRRRPPPGRGHAVPASSGCV
jgi:hypothetical protein